MVAHAFKGYVTELGTLYKAHIHTWGGEGRASSWMKSGWGLGNLGKLFIHRQASVVMFVCCFGFFVGSVAMCCKGNAGWLG